MKRNSTPSMGALHPIFFLLMIYIISVVLALFVCTTIYKSLQAASPIGAESKNQQESLTVYK